MCAGCALRAVEQEPNFFKRTYLKMYIYLLIIKDGIFDTRSF